MDDWLKKVKGITGPGNYRTLLIVAAFILTLPLWAQFIPGDVLHIDIVNLMVLCGVYSCAVIGLNVLIGYAGQVSLGHAAFFGIGAYTVGIMCTKLTWFPTWFAILLGAALAGAIGWLVGVPVLRLKGNYLAMATLGLGAIFFIIFREGMPSILRWLMLILGPVIVIAVAIWQLVLMKKGSRFNYRPVLSAVAAFAIIEAASWLFLLKNTKGTVGIVSIPPLSIFGFSFDNDFRMYYAVWVIALILVLFTINIINSRVGRGLRALHSSEVAADAMGVDTSSYKTKVFVLSAVFAGIGGGLFAVSQRYINPDSFQFTLSVLFVTMVVVGGMGDIWGGIVGVVILTFLPAVITAMPDWIPVFPQSLSNFNNYTLVLYGLLLIVFMIFLPKGITYGLSRGGVYLQKTARRLRDRRRSRKTEGG